MLENHLRPLAFDAFEFLLDPGGLLGIPRVILGWVLPASSLGFLLGGFSPFRVWGVVFQSVAVFVFVLMCVGTVVDVEFTSKDPKSRTVECNMI